MLKIYYTKKVTQEVTKIDAGSPSHISFNKFCKKHNKELQHGLNHEFPYKSHKEGYHINKFGYFSHCIDCLIEIHTDIYGGSLFD